MCGNKAQDSYLDCTQLIALKLAGVSMYSVAIAMYRYTMILAEQFYYEKPSSECILVLYIAT